MKLSLFSLTSILGKKGFVGINHNNCYSISTVKPRIASLFRYGGDADLASFKARSFLQLKTTLSGDGITLQQTIDAVRLAATDTYNARFDVVTHIECDIEKTVSDLEAEQQRQVLVELNKANNEPVENLGNGYVPTEHDKGRITEAIKSGRITLLQASKRGYKTGSFEEKLKDALIKSGLVVKKNKKYSLRDDLTDNQKEQIKDIWAKLTTIKSAKKEGAGIQIRFNDQNNSNGSALAFGMMAGMAWHTAVSNSKK